MQHIGVHSVRQWAMTLLGGNAPAHFFDFFAEPDLLEIVVIVAQIPKIIGSHAARPDGAVGIDLRAHPSGIAVNDLVFLLENTLDQFVVLHANRLGDLGHAGKLFAFDIGNEPIDGLRISGGSRGNGQTDGIQLHARLGNFSDELIGAGLIGVRDEFVQVANAEYGDHGVDAHGQILEALSQRKELLQALFELDEIPWNSTDVVVLRANPVQRKIDDQLALGAGLGDLLHAVRDVGENSVGGDVDYTGAAVVV